MITKLGQVSNEKIITTSDNLKNVKAASNYIMSELNTKSYVVDKMTDDEYTDYIYLKLLAREAKRKAKTLEMKKTRF